MKVLLADTQKCRKQLPAPHHAQVCAPGSSHHSLSSTKSSCAGHSQTQPTYLWLLKVLGLLALLFEPTVNLHSPRDGVTESATERGFAKNITTSIFSYSLISVNASNGQTSVEVSCQRSLKIQFASF